MTIVMPNHDLVELNILKFSLQLCILWGGGKKQGGKDEDDGEKGVETKRTSVDFHCFGHVMAPSWKKGPVLWGCVSRINF